MKTVESMFCEHRRKARAFREHCSIARLLSGHRRRVRLWQRFLTVGSLALLRIGFAAMVAVVAVGVVGCQVELQDIPVGRVHCETNGACPSGYKCNRASRACVPASADDTAGPEVLAATVEPPYVREGVVLTVELVVSEPLLVEPLVVFMNAGVERQLSVRTDRPQGVDGQPRESGIQPTYYLQYKQRGDEIDGSVALAATLVDRFGNVSRVPLGVPVAFDFTAPELVDSATVVALRAPPGSLLAAVRELGLLSQLEVGLLAAEVLRHIEIEARPEVTSACEDVPLNCDGSGAAFYCSYLLTSNQAPCEESHQLWAYLEDLAGNPAEVLLPLRLADGTALEGLTFDLTAPAAPAVSFPDTVVFHRMPWGSTQSPSGFGGSAIPAYTLLGKEGAAEAGSTLVVFDRENVAEGVELGRAEVDPDGAFGAFSTFGESDDSATPLTLRTTDRLRVYLVAVDGAGNASDANGELEGVQAVSVHDVWWTASLAGKRAGSEFENPQGLRQRLSYDARVRTPVSDGDAGGAALDEVDGDALTTTGAGSWQDVTMPEMPPIAGGSYGQAATDWGRGEAIVMGGATASNTACRHRCVGLCQGVKRLRGGRWSDVAIVDPELDGNPSARWHGGMAWSPLREAIILFGGSVQSGGGAPLDDTWAWTGKSWRQLCTDDGCTAPAARSGHAMATDLNRQRVVLFGGSTASGEIGETWEWDGEGWQEVCLDAACLTETPSARSGHAMAYDPSGGGVLLFGGSNGSDETWRFDGQRWRRLCVDVECKTPPEGRWGHQLAADPVRGEVVLFGGCRGGAFPVCRAEVGDGVALEDTWVWRDGQWNQQTGVGDLPSARSGATLVFDPLAVELVLVAGQTEVMQGICGFIDRVTPWDVFGWDGSQWRLWPESGPGPRDGHGMAYDGVNETVVLHGGSVGTERSTTVWRWDGLHWRSDTTMTLPAVDGHGLAERGDGSELFFYGGNDGTTVQALHREYSSVGWSVCASGSCFVPVDAARIDHAVVWSGSQFILFGGVNTAGDTEASTGFYGWNGSGWEALCSDLGCESIPHFTRHAMAFDGATGQAVLFGGLFWGGAWAIPSRDTWRWTGATWQSVANVDPRPLNRSAHAMAYDPTRQRVLMFGGDVRTYGMFGRDDCGKGVPQCDDLWELGDYGWAPPRQSDPELDGEPTVRQEHALAFDRNHGTAVLHGGRNDMDGQLGDTWLWEGGGSSRPAHVAEIHFALSGESREITPVGVDVRWYAGGTGMPEGIVTDGVTLWMWDRTAFVDVTVGDGTADEPTLMTWSTPPSDTATDLWSLFNGSRATLRVAVTPAAPGGTEYAEISTDYVEVTVRYRDER